MPVCTENTVCHVYFTLQAGIYMPWLFFLVHAYQFHSSAFQLLDTLPIFVLPWPWLTAVTQEGLTWYEHRSLSGALVSVAQHAPALCWPPAARLSGVCAGISSDGILPAPGGRGACISAESKCKVWSPWNSCHLHCHHWTWRRGKKNRWALSIFF